MTLRMRPPNRLWATRNHGMTHEQAIRIRFRVWGGKKRGNKRHFTPLLLFLLWVGSTSVRSTTHTQFGFFKL
jgi:hypothetical protein